MVLRADRADRSGGDPTLHARILLLCLGAGCAFAGIFYDTNWLITLGIVILAAGIVVRLVNDRRRRDAQDARWRAEAEREEDGDGTVPSEDPAPEGDSSTPRRDGP